MAPGTQAQGKALKANPTLGTLEGCADSAGDIHLHLEL